MRISDWSSDVCSSDLFSDSASENWIDGDVLDRLADEKLAAEAESIRAREGYEEIRAVPMTRISFADYDGLRPVRGEIPEPTAEEEARCAEIEAEMNRSEEHTSELQSLMRNSYAVFCLKQKNTYDTLIPK